MSLATTVPEVHLLQDERSRAAESPFQAGRREQRVKPVASANNYLPHTNQPAHHSAKGSTSEATLQQPNGNNYGNLHNSKLLPAQNNETTEARIAYATNSERHASKNAGLVSRIV